MQLGFESDMFARGNFGCARGINHHGQDSNHTSDYTSLHNRKRLMEVSIKRARAPYRRVSRTNEPQPQPGFASFQQPRPNDAVNSMAMGGSAHPVCCREAGDQYQVFQRARLVSEIAVSRPPETWSFVGRVAISCSHNMPE